MTARVLHGDCREVLRTLDAESVHACVTDPPYHLTSIVKRFGSAHAAPAQFGKDGAFARASRGFMGKVWDGGDIAFRPDVWRDVMRVLKPGAHMLAFGGTRTFHRMICAIEDAGFEIRDTLMWMYGSGFPKSHNLDGEWTGWGTSLKPGWEPIVLARKPLSEPTVAANVLAHGCGALNIDGCRIGWASETDKQAGRPASFAKAHSGFEGQAFAIADRSHRSPEAEQSPLGRFPANVTHDGSDEVMEAFAAFRERATSAGAFKRKATLNDTSDGWGMRADQNAGVGYGDTGTAARFFYCSKASAKDRAGSKHPTVKPLSLMRYLARLITPPGGTVLDPFAGSGTTLQAAVEEGFHAIGIEQEAEYHADILRRLDMMRPVQPSLLAT